VREIEGIDAPLASTAIASFRFSAVARKFESARRFPPGTAPAISA
jgi:hypothetical protein